MPLPSEQHQNTTSEYAPCKTDTHRGMIKHMLGCLGKVLPDRSLFNMSDYIIQHHVDCVDVSQILDNKKMLFYYENVCTTASKAANIAYLLLLSSEGVTNADSICPVRVKRYSVVKRFLAK